MAAKKDKSKLRIIPLGGLGEIGKNITVFEYGDDMIVVDIGSIFPREDMPGVDLVIPDTTYIEKNISKLRGYVITHGHEDHIGASPYVLKELPAPVYGSRIALALIDAKLKEHRVGGVELNVIEPGDTVKLGVFKVEFIKVNHSIAGSCALAIHTPVGVIVHSGDFKVDYTPVDGARIDLGRFEEGTSYEDILAPLLRQGSWYFDSQGLVIFSSLYEISSYAAGPIFFCIPYADLQGHIDDRWLPEEIQGSGSLELAAGGEMLPDNIPIIDKLDVDGEGEALYLIVHGSVRNLRIARGEYVDSFYVTQDLWSCGSMDNCALQLQCLIPEGMPNLRISYDDAQGSHVYYLSHSAQDGSAVLTDTVEAVG